MNKYKRIQLFSTVAISMLALAMVNAGQSDLLTPIFNGKNLDGLIGETKWWSVKNGELIGESKSKRDPEDFSWIVTKDQYKDFELTLWCKLSGDNNRNSGVYYRGKWNDENQVVGYEFDLGGWGGEKELWWGEIHDPFGRELFVKPILSMDELKDLYNKKGWNHVRIRAEGNHIQHWLNGVKTADWIEEDPDMQNEGFIGFQMHNETKFKVRFRDIRLTIIEGE